MTLQKPFAHFDSLSTFKSKKISASADNTTYIDWDNDETETFGTPEILYETICFIDNELLLFTHGSFYSTKMSWDEL